MPGERSLLTKGESGKKFKEGVESSIAAGMAQRAFLGGR